MLNRQISTHPLPLRGSDVEFFSFALASRLTGLDVTFAAAGITQRQNRGTVATGLKVPKAHDTDGSATRYLLDDPA